MKKRYFKILDTEETREFFEGLIGHTCEMVNYNLTCKEKPHLGGTYTLKTVEGNLIFNEDEIEEV